MLEMICVSLLLEQGDLPPPFDFFFLLPTTMHLFDSLLRDIFYILHASAFVNSMKAFFPRSRQFTTKTRPFPLVLG